MLVDVGLGHEDPRATAPTLNKAGKSHPAAIGDAVPAGPLTYSSSYAGVYFPGVDRGAIQPFAPAGTTKPVLLLASRSATAAFVSGNRYRNAAPSSVTRTTTIDRRLSALVNEKTTSVARYRTVLPLAVQRVYDSSIRRTGVFPVKRETCHECLVVAHDPQRRPLQHLHAIA